MTGIKIQKRIENYFNYVINQILSNKNVYKYLFCIWRDEF